MTGSVSRPIQIVIAGGGFGGVYTFKELHRLFHNHPGIRVTLVNRTNYFLFTPLLHEVATGSLAPEHIVEPLRKVLGCCHHDFHFASIREFSLSDKVVRTAAGDIPYDYLVFAMGSTTNFYGIPGADVHSLPLKTLEDALRIKNRIIQATEAAVRLSDEKERERRLRFILVGGGATGVELAGEMSDFIFKTFGALYPFVRKSASIILISKAPELLPEFHGRLRQKSLEILKKKGVRVVLSAAVKAVEPGAVLLENGETIEGEMVIWTAGVKPHPVRTADLFSFSPAGRIRVSDDFEVTGWPGVFALGDMAHGGNEDRPLPALAQVATRQAKAVARNIARSIDGQPKKPFRYRHSGDLISLGTWTAVGNIRGFHFWGPFAWWLWRTVYLLKMISWGKKIKVAVDWTVNIFLPRDISQIPFESKTDD